MGTSGDAQILRDGLLTRARGAEEVRHDPAGIPARPAGASVTVPLFCGSNRRADLIAGYPELDAACERMRFGWEDSLEEWCAEPEWAILELARQAKPPPPAAVRDWSLESIPALLEDIIATHHDRLRQELRRVVILMRQFSHRHAEPIIGDMNAAFAMFAESMLTHINHEEAEVFPLVLAIDAANHDPQSRGPFDLDILGALRFMELGHENALSRMAIILTRLEAIAIASADPDIDVIRDALKGLISCLILHEFKEEKILLPAMKSAMAQLGDRTPPRIPHHDLAS